MDADNLTDPTTGELTWLTHEKFSNFKNAEFAKMGLDPSDRVEDLLIRLASVLGYQAMFGTETPWLEKTRIQLRTFSGTAVTQGSLTEVLNWLCKLAPSVKLLKLAANESHELQSVTLQATRPSNSTRL